MYTQKSNGPWGLLLLLLPIVLFFVVTILYTVNIPYNDDFPTILDFLTKQHHTESWGQRIQQFIEPYGEHRVFFIRFFAFLQHTIFGTLNFTWLAFIGNVGFLFFFYYLASSFPEKESRLWYWVALAFLMFQLQTWSNYTWAMASLENTLVFCWTGAAFYYAFKYEDKTMALVFAILATYTNGNGIFVLAILAFLFLLQKNWKIAAGYFIVFAMLFKFNNSHLSGSFVEKFQSQSVSLSIGKFFVFVGSNVFHPSYTIVAMLLGVLITAYFVFLFFVKKYYTLNPVVTALFLFVFITALAVATQRENMDISTVAPSRYRIYGTLALACVFISLFDWTPERWHRNLLRIALPLTVLFYIGSSYAGFAKIKSRNNLNRIQAYILEKGIALDTAFNRSYQDGLTQGFIKRSNIKINDIANTPATVNRIVDCPNPIHHIDTLFQDENYIGIKGWCGKKDDQNALNKVFVGWQHDNTITWYNSSYMDVIPFLNSKDSLRFANCGFFVAIPFTVLPDSLILGVSRGQGSSEVEKIVTFATAP
jgi:hypothetical protein